MWLTAIGGKERAPASLAMYFATHDPCSMTPMLSESTVPNANAVVLTSEQLLNHWQGHRRVTRRLIEIYPDDKLFTYSLGGMRTFGELAMEILTMGVPMVKGTISGEWENVSDRSARPRAEMLRLWDEATKQLDELWPQIPAARFQETIKAFGQYDGKAYDLLMYVIDNEIHHRGQGYVYLRTLGIEPPPFYDRS